MDFMEAIFALPAIAALVAVYFYLSEGNHRRAPRDLVTTRKRPRIRRLQHKNVVKCYNSHRPSLLLYVYPDGEEPKEDLHRPFAMHEVLGMLPWIPRGTSIFLVAEGGFTRAMLRSLETLSTSRELFLIEGAQDAQLVT